MNPRSRFPIRNALTATCLLGFTQFSIAQNASNDANTDVFTVRD
jgi:hypothetical protein